jgi:predicted helicase
VISQKAQAEKDNAKLYGMNKEEWFGKELYVITFSEAVKRNLLVDYKVIVLAVEESHVSRRIQNLLKDPDNQLKVDDAAKIIGCWKALSKQGLADDLSGDGASHATRRGFLSGDRIGQGRQDAQGQLQANCGHVPGA